MNNLWLLIACFSSLTYAENSNPNDITQFSRKPKAALIDTIGIHRRVRTAAAFTATVIVATTAAYFRALREAQQTLNSRNQP